jgi:adenylate kinase family enzyme
LKINVVGTSGSGKTTFGKQLAEILNILFIELDAIYWGPQWSGPTDQELFSRLREALKADSWVLDGNYSRTEDIKWEHIEAVIWLDFSFPRTVYQAILRAITRLHNQEELWSGTGNRESLRMLFSRDSIVLYTIQAYGRRKKKYHSYIGSDEYSHIHFHRLRSPREANQFLKDLKQDPFFLSPRPTN